MHKNKKTTIRDDRLSCVSPSLVVGEVAVSCLHFINVGPRGRWKPSCMSSGGAMVYVKTGHDGPNKAPSFSLTIVLYKEGGNQGPFPAGT